MNYLSLIRRFWQEVEMKDFLPSEACAYFRLVEVCNQLGWQNPFSLSNSRAVVLMAMNEKTFRAMRDKLAERGLIEFRKGSRRESKPWYCLPVLNDEGEWIFDWSDFLEVKNTAKNTAKPSAKREVKPSAKHTAKPSAYNKTKIEIENINNNNVVVDAPEATLFSEVDLKQPKRKKEKTPKEPPHIPDLDEVLEYFQRMDAPTRLQDWEASARLFFDTYNADGWINKYGRKVANWESEANKWIYYREEAEKKSQTNKPTVTHNEQTQTTHPNRSNAPSGGIPIRGKVTPSCGLKRRDKGGEN